MITEGVVAFCNLSETEKYKGQDTGRYTVVLTIDDGESEALKSAGVHVKSYDNGTDILAQRKFFTKFPDFPVINTNGEPVSRDIPYGSKVKILWVEGKPHPVHGVPPYIKKIKVLEYAGNHMTETETEDF